MKNMKRVLTTAFCALLLSGCVTPVKYGDVSGFMGMGFLAKKTVTFGYDGQPKPFEEVGILALDSRLRIRSINTRDGSVVNTVSKTIGGLGIINSPTDVQIHLLPGEYVLSTCFFIDMGNQGSAYCKTPLELPVALSANQIIQLSWSSAKAGGWTVLQEPVSEEIKGRIVQDYSKVMNPQP